MDKVKKLLYNRRTKTFSNQEKKKFIENFCQVLPSKNEFMPNDHWIKVVMNDCYLTSSTSLERILAEQDIIDFLIEHDITEVHSSFNKDEYHENPVANYGFSPNNGKWYGWSHRAWHDFGIGDKPKEFYPDKTVEGPEIKNLEEAKNAAIKFAESVA
jgi:hypothetical protein